MKIFNSEHIIKIKELIVQEKKNELFNYLIVVLMPGIFHEINNNFCIIDGINMIVSRKKDEDKISTIRKHFNNFSDSNKLMKEKLRSSVMLLSDYNLEFPLDFETIIKTIEINLKTQLYKNFNTELNCETGENGIINCKTGQLIYSLIISILIIAEEYGYNCMVNLRAHRENDTGRIELKFKAEKESVEFLLVSKFLRKIIEDSKGKMIVNEFKNNEFGFILEFSTTEV